MPLYIYIYILYLVEEQIYLKQTLQGVASSLLHVWISSQARRKVFAADIPQELPGSNVQPSRFVARCRKVSSQGLVARFSLQTYPLSQGPRRNVRRKVVARFRRKVSSQGPVATYRTPISRNGIAQIGPDYPRSDGAPPRP